MFGVSQQNAIMKCGHLDRQEIRTCEMQSRTFGTATFLVMEQADVLSTLFPLGGC
jgi:hypothetical protein